MDFKAAIFDLDGTVLDSMHVWRKVDENFLKKRGIEVTAEYTNAVSSMNFDQAADYTIKKYLLKETLQEVIEEWKSMVDCEYKSNIRLKKGALKYLLKLKSDGKKLGVASALSFELMESVLKNNNIYHLFDAFSATSEVKRGKGFPDIYLLTAERLKEAPENCIVFEDILPGIRGALCAGMKVCGVYEKASEHFIEQIKNEADYFINDFTELL